MRRALFSFWTWFEFLSVGVLMFPVMGAAALVHGEKDPGRRARGQWMRRYGRWTSHLTPLWHFKVEGDLPPDYGSKAYVVVSNHESNADPFLICQLKADMRWIAKEEIFKLPFLGWLMNFGGDIKLRRGDGASVKAMFEECARTLKAGVSVMIFPEGTRSKTGELLPFKDGAFSLAIAEGADILPMVLAGTKDCMPKGSGWMHDAHATIKVLPPVSVKGLGEKDVPRLREQVRDLIAKEVVVLREQMGITEAPKGPRLVKSSAA